MLIYIHIAHIYYDLRIYEYDMIHYINIIVSTK
jgi:hypothetical protein